MLKEIFNTASRTMFPPPDQSRQPVILVSTLGHDKTTGDAHGYTGIGQIVAKKLNGLYHHVNEDILNRDYPGQGTYTALTAYMQEIGRPDIVFARNYSWQSAMNDNDKKYQPFIVSYFNETLSGKFGTETELVAHHLTQDLLQSEGQRFLKIYPFLPRPLVAVMMADKTWEHLPQKLLSLLQNVSAATLFICTSSRTPEGSYHAMMRDLSNVAYNVGLQDKIHLVGYNFERNRGKGGFNPYTGLLHNADHIVVCGESRSIIAEGLATGKTIHRYGGRNFYDTLESRGFIRLFDHYTVGDYLQTHAIAPLNVTEQIADGIIAAYRHELKKKQSLRTAIGAYLNRP